MNKGEKDKASGFKNRSLIASVDITQSELNVATPISGLDCVILLSATNESCIKRATGQFIDPITNNTYHIEHNPPPSDAPVKFTFILGNFRKTGTH
jgi:hypothetical protein